MIREERDENVENNFIIKKSIFYALLLMNNILALGLIGIGFLTGPGVGGEGTTSSSETTSLLRFGSYGVIISLLFSGTSFLIGFLFRNSLNISNKKLKYLAAIEFTFFILTFITISIIMFI